MRSSKAVRIGWILAALVLCLPQFAFAWGEVREATTDLNVRSDRRADAPKILTLKKGQQVKVDFVSDNWGAIFALTTAERDEKKAIGFASLRYLKYVSAAPEVASPEALPPVPELETRPMAVAGDASEEGPDIVAEREGEVVARVNENVDEVVEQGQGEEKPPVQITSERMIYNDAKRTVVFEGAVEAVHAGLVLHADTLTAHFSGKERKNSEAIERIVAEGSVRVNRKTTQGRCQRLTYMVEEGILRMEGNPVLQDGENTITGEVIKFYMKDNRSEVLGGNGKRVKAVLSAPGEVGF